jgi:hypothetical protein
LLCTKARRAEEAIYCTEVSYSLRNLTICEQWPTTSRISIKGKGQPTGEFACASGFPGLS